MTIGLRPSSSGLEVTRGSASLAGLAITTIPARSGPAGAAGVRSAQVPTSFAATRLPTNGALVVLPSAFPADVSVLRLTTKAGQAFPRPKEARGWRATASLNVEASVLVATSTRRAYVRQPTAAISPTLPQAIRTTYGRAATLPVGPTTAYGAAPEETLPQVLATEVPEVPPASVPFGPRRARPIPAAPGMGAPYVPATLTARLESGTVIKTIPPTRAVILARTLARR